MANEIYCTAALQITKGGVTISGSIAKYNDMAGVEMISNIQSVGTVAEALNFGDITGTPGMVFVKNIDETNYVELALDSNATQIFAKLLPGQGIVFPPGAAVIYGKAHTAACSCHVAACEA